MSWLRYQREPGSSKAHPLLIIGVTTLLLFGIALCIALGQIDSALRGFDARLAGIEKQLKRIPGRAPTADSEFNGVKMPDPITDPPPEKKR